MQTTLGFRIAHGLLERPVYREFFAAGLTVFDPVEGFDSTAEARFDVQNLIREIGLITDHADPEGEAFHEIELKMAAANNGVTDKEDHSEETNKHTATLVPELPAV
jgi:hypothetical protein